MAEISPKETVDELKELVVAYARQETVEPLKQLGAWAGFGLAGAICMAIGGLLVCLGLLRVLQTMTWSSGFWSWGPYLIVTALLCVLTASCVVAATRQPAWLDEDQT